VDRNGFCGYDVSALVLLFCAVEFHIGKAGLPKSYGEAQQHAVELWEYWDGRFALAAEQKRNGLAPFGGVRIMLVRKPHVYDELHCDSPAFLELRVEPNSIPIFSSIRTCRFGVCRPI
jgi:hypothetical protein